MNLHSGMSDWAKLLAAWMFALILAANLTSIDQCGPTAYDCGTYYVERQQFLPAIRYLNQVLIRQPGNLKALNLLGIALTGAGQIERANGQFRQALKLNPLFYPALKNLAINEVTLRHTAAAKAHFEQVLKYAPSDEIANLYLGEILFAEKHCGPALEHYDKCRMRIVNNSACILHYAQCSLEQRRQNTALTMLDLIPTTDANSHFQAGVLLGRSDVYAEAAKHFALARQGYADPYAAGYNETVMYIRSGDFQAAIETTRELISQGYERGELYNLVSEAYVKNRQIQEAYNALRKATQIDPLEENNYLDLATICLDYANYDLGLEITEIGLRHVPNSDRLYLQRGTMYAMKGQFEEAEKTLEMAAKLAPEKTLPYVGLGIAWMQRGQVEKAIGVLREKARQNPSDFLIQYVFAEALLRSGPQVGSRAEHEAFAAVETSIRLNPDFVHTRAQMGKMLMKRGEVDRAIEELERAVALDPSELGATFQLAQAYRRKGNQARAEELQARVKEFHAQERQDYPTKALKRLVKETVPGFSASRTSP